MTVAAGSDAEPTTDVAQLMRHDAEVEIPVLIVGGSMVGMTTALLLGFHGVPSLVVEHHRGTAIHPRAHDH